jgi:hypothetical protein
MKPASAIKIHPLNSEKTQTYIAILYCQMGMIPSSPSLGFRSNPRPTNADYDEHTINDEVHFATP